MKAHLQTAGLLLRQGTIVDATIIVAPSSTKNSKGVREPKMRQEPVVVRHEGPRQGRCQEELGAQRDRHSSQPRRCDEGG